MKGAHITLRFPSDLAKLLDRMAHAQGVPRSQVVREAVARYVSPRTADRNAERVVTASDLAARWASLPALVADEAAAFAEDVSEARDRLPPVDGRWE
ncbi:MAG: ribbon-helix-helix protein, CopG family [Gemmatimonadales bacterium]